MVGSGSVSNSWDEEFHPSAAVRSVLQWAREHGAVTLGEAYDLLEQFEISNDIPEVLGEDDTVEDIRDELEQGIDIVGSDAPLTSVV